MAVNFQMGELFCGPGGMALGAHSAAQRLSGIGLQHAWANDYDPDTCETYLANIPGSERSSVYCQDVRSLDVSLLDAIDGFAFGFPCNDYSSVGKSRGINGKFGPLYSYGVDVLNSHNPKWFVAENVSGLSSTKHGETFGRILAELSVAGDFGYRVTPHLYSFDQYGVPQRRKRIVVVGIRQDLNLEYEVPSPSIYSQINVSAGYALSTPPMTAEMGDHNFTRQSPAVVERLKHIKPGQNAFNAELPEHLQLNVRGAKISQIYRRLRPDEPSYTITGSGGGGTHGYHWDEPRALTNRERARLQSFPDNFIFVGSKESVRKQIGMAVPSRGAEAIFTAVFNTFLGLSYPKIRANISWGASATVRATAAG